MTDEKKLPAKIDVGSEIALTRPGGSLVTRGLEAIRGNGANLLSLSSDAELEDAFWKACDREEFETALEIIYSLDNRGSALAETLSNDLWHQAEPSCISFGDETDDHNELIASKLESCLRLRTQLNPPPEKYGQGDGCLKIPG